MRSYFVSLDTVNETVSVSGIEQPDAELVKYENETIVCKVAGFRYQYGSYSDMSSYQRAMFQVYRVVDILDFNGKTGVSGLRCELLTEFPVKR